jgi:hypothetical protein
MTARQCARLAFGLALLSSGCAITGRTPEESVTQYWTYMAAGDRNRVLRTQSYYRPGMSSRYIWCPKDIEWLYLDSLVTEYDGNARARVYYQVVLRGKGQAVTTRYRTGSLMVRRNGRWRFGRAIGRRD